MPVNTAFICALMLGLTLAPMTKTFAQEQVGAPAPTPEPSVETPVGEVPTASTPAAAPTPALTPAAYHSDADDLLSIDKVSILPFTDNLQGIYARPLEAHFTTLVEGLHRWDFVPANVSGPVLAPDELELAPEKVRELTKDMHVDAAFAGRITKGPDGVTIHLSLFLTRDGQLLSQAILKSYPRFDLTELKTQLGRLMNEVVTRLPFAGRVLSRDGNRVTINLGAQDGIKKDQTLSVIQILQVQRHPKFNFLIRTEKEIFGRVRVLKADDTLSFGTIVMEKERGAVQKGAKIANLDSVTYPASDSLGATPRVEDELAQREDGKLAFGDDPKAWRPERPPSIGGVGVRLGLGRFTGATTLGQIGGLQASDGLSPSLSVDGELWITPEWTFHARLKQGLVTVTNPRRDSTPGRLNESLSLYDLGFGYSVRFGEQATSPTVEPFLGYFLHRLYADDSSPIAFTTMRYQGFKLGVRGTTPLADGAYGVGGEFAMALGPTLSESPVSSGSSPRNTVVQFGIDGYKSLGQRLRLTFGIDFEMYATNFSGEGGRGAESATSASQRYTTITTGVNYLF